jgi:hypothetical protein
MSHGKIVTLDTPKNIKRSFGVGYNFFVEPKSNDLSAEEKQALYAKARDIFLSVKSTEQVTESSDSSDKKLIFLVPISL